MTQVDPQKVEGTLFLDFEGLDDDVFDGAIHGACASHGDLVHNIHAFDDFAEDGVFAVKPWSCRHSHEKLTAIGSRSGVGH